MNVRDILDILPQPSDYKNVSIFVVDPIAGRNPIGGVKSLDYLEDGSDINLDDVLDGLQKTIDDMADANPDVSFEIVNERTGEVMMRSK